MRARQPRTQWNRPPLLQRLKNKPTQILREPRKYSTLRCSSIAVNPFCHKHLGVWQCCCTRKVGPGPSVVWREQ
jgi:hypothetical protein